MLNFVTKKLGKCLWAESHRVQTESEIFSIHSNPKFKVSPRVMWACLCMKTFSIMDCLVLHPVLSNPLWPSFHCSLFSFYWLLKFELKILLFPQTSPDHLSQTECMYLFSELLLLQSRTSSCDHHLPLKEPFEMSLLFHEKHVSGLFSPKRWWTLRKKTFCSLGSAIKPTANVLVDIVFSFAYWVLQIPARLPTLKDFCYWGLFRVCLLV